MENTLLSLAIERVAGNNLKNIKDDSEFERKLTILIKSYQHWYYVLHIDKTPNPTNLTVYSQIN